MRLKSNARPQSGIFTAQFRAVGRYFYFDAVETAAIDPRLRPVHGIDGYLPPDLFYRWMNTVVPFAQ